MSTCPYCEKNKLRTLASGVPGKTCGLKACIKKMLSQTAHKKPWKDPQTPVKKLFIPASAITGRLYT